MSYRKMSAEEAQANRDAKRARASALIDSALVQLTDPAYWSAMLTRGQSLGRYSIRNQLLIGMQCPEASDVAGYVEWQGRGRQVNSGPGSGILIYAPVTRKTTEQEIAAGADEGARRIRGTKVVSVFDISQTEPIQGKPFKPAVTVDPRRLEEIRATIADLAGDNAGPILDALDRAAGALVAA